jgi:oligoribonuclease
MTETELLVWMDLEMTGLAPAQHRIIEIATLVTDAQLELVAEGPDLVIYQPDEVLDGMNDWSREHHASSGLLGRVRDSNVSESEAQAQTLRFLAEHCPPAAAPLAGNSVHVDRFFLKHYMPELESYLHYRNVDVTSIKELARRWYPRTFARLPKKTDTHRAVDDIRESIAELRFYREHVFRAEDGSDR